MKKVDPHTAVTATSASAGATEVRDSTRQGYLPVALRHRPLHPAPPLTAIPPGGTFAHRRTRSRGVGVHGYASSTEQYLTRLRRIEGQVRGLQRMVSEGEYCIDILTQVAAVQSAIDSVALGLVQDHLGHCVVQAAKESDEAGAAKVAEATQAIARLVKC
ncbi:metal-sensitive transcriptional regulator [Schaalia sp. 19OD2882]|nr:metal-sensitive transcriptional regulator [Schaalia sp. 19OD2882]